MSDTSLNKFLGQGDDAVEGAFTPDPPTVASGPDPLVLFLNTESTPDLKYWDGANFTTIGGGGGSGTVTNTGTLTDHAVIVGNGTVDVSALGSLGTTATVLHGNASGDPTFGAVALGSEVSGDLPFANLTQIAGLSVLGVAGSATADVAAITATVDGQVLTRVSSSSLAFATPASSGALVLLEQHTASSSAALNFTTGITSTYDEYMLELVGLLAQTNTANLRVQFSTDGGANYDTGTNYGWAGSAWRSGSAASSYGAEAGATYIGLTDDLGQSNSNTWGTHGSLRLVNPLSTTAYKVIYGKINYYYGSGSFLVGNDFNGSYQVTTAANAFRLIESTGNIVSGTARLYGIAK